MVNFRSQETKNYKKSEGLVNIGPNQEEVFLKNQKIDIEPKIYQHLSRGSIFCQCEKKEKILVLLWTSTQIINTSGDIPQK
jgi:hypothetical protein